MAQHPPLSSSALGPGSLTVALTGAVVLAALLVKTTSAPAAVDTATTGPAAEVAPRSTAPQAKSVADTPFEVHAGLDQPVLLADGGEDRFLVVELVAPAPDGPRQAVDLAVVMDTSGSMWGEGKMEQARRAASELVGQLGPRDTFSLVSFDSAVRTVIPAQSVVDPGALQRTIAGISPDGGTWLSGGLEQGLALMGTRALARQRTEDPAVQRVVVLSDGIANKGITDRRALARLAATQRDAGVSVTALGLGVDFDEDVLTAISDGGGGRYRYVHSGSDLAGLFAEELEQLGHVEARGATVDVALAPGIELLAVYGYEEIDGGRTSTGFQAYLGDLHAGETRKVVARVRVPDGAAGHVPVGEVTVGWRESGTRSHAAWTQDVSARVTPDAGLARRSVDRRAGELAAMAVAGTILDQGNRAWAAGDLASAQEQLASGQDELQRLSRTYGVSSLADIAQELGTRSKTYAATQPASRAGISYRQQNQLEALGYVE